MGIAGLQEIASFRIPFALLCCAALIPILPLDVARGVDYGAEIALVEGYTSNIFLAPEGFEESEWLTVVVPRVYFDHVQSRYELEFDYRMEALFYSDKSEFNEAYSDLWTRGAFDLIDEKLSVMGLIRFTQVNINPEGRLPDNNVNITRNRSDAFAWEVGPRWNQALVANSEVDAHYYVGTISYDDRDTQGVTTQRGEFFLRTLDRSLSPVAYEVSYRYGRYDYDVTGATQFQHLYLELSYVERPLFQPTVIVGAESNLVTNDGLLDEPYWEAGVRSTVKSNLFEAFYGHRFYGPTYRLRWTRTNDKSDLWADYQETQQTPESAALDDLGSDVDAGISPSAGSSLTPDNGLNRPGTGIRSLRKRATVNYRLRRYRGDTLLYAFWVDNDQVFTPEVSPTDPLVITSVDKSVGAGLNVSWNLGLRTTVSLFGEWNRRDFDSGNQTGSSISDEYRTNARIQYRIGRRIELCALVGYQDQSGQTVEWNEVNAAVRLKWNFAGAGEFDDRNTGATPMDCARVF